MFRPKAMTILLVFCACVLLAFLTHHVYENHVSSDFKRIMRAASDLQEPIYEQKAYLHDARLAVKTDKDQQILDDYETAFSQMQQAEKESETVKQETADLMKQIEEANASIDRERELPYADTSAFQKQVGEMVLKFKARKTQIDAELETSKHDGEQAIQLMRKVRSELGLPDALAKYTIFPPH